MRTFTVNKSSGVNSCIDVIQLPSEGRRLFGVELCRDSVIPLDREEPASVAWIGEGHSVIRTANVATGPVLTLSEYGLSLDKDKDALVLLDYYLLPDEGSTNCKQEQGLKLIGTSPVEEGVPVVTGWNNPDPHDCFHYDAWRIRELVQFSVGGYQEVAFLEGERDGRFLYSEYFITYDYCRAGYDFGNALEDALEEERRQSSRPRLKIVSSESFKRNRKSQETA